MLCAPHIELDVHPFIFYAIVYGIDQSQGCFHQRLNRALDEITNRLPSILLSLHTRFADTVFGCASWMCSSMRSTLMGTYIYIYIYFVKYQMHTCKAQMMAHSHTMSYILLKCNNYGNLFSNYLFLHTLRASRCSSAMRTTFHQTNPQQASCARSFQFAPLNTSRPSFVLILALSLWICTILP